MEQVNTLLAMIVAVAVLTTSYPLSANPPMRSQSAHRHQSCDPLGRIVSGEGRNFEVGHIVCRGDRLAQMSQTTQILCFTNRAIVTLPDRTIEVNDNLCRRPNVTTPTQLCGENENGLCFDPKGEGETAFELLQPEQVFTTNRPQIVWTAVNRASVYIVRVSGQGVQWERQAQGTQLSYPSEETALQPGNAYRIVVVARDTAETIATTQRVVNFPFATINSEVQR